MKVTVDAVRMTWRCNVYWCGCRCCCSTGYKTMSRQVASTNHI